MKCRKCKQNITNPRSYMDFFGKGVLQNICGNCSKKGNKPQVVKYTTIERFFAGKDAITIAM